MLDKLVSLADSDIQTIVLIEYFSFKKIQSIRNDACAFQRPKFNNAVPLLTWGNNTPENLVLARRIAREFASIIEIGQKEYLNQVEQQEYVGQVKQGYSNYGTFGLYFI